ncbi:MAG: hypothetical protein AAGC60_13200 [Acidobacteriota bacterium]
MNDAKHLDERLSIHQPIENQVGTHRESADSTPECIPRGSDLRMLGKKPKCIEEPGMLSIRSTRILFVDPAPNLEQIIVSGRSDPQARHAADSRSETASCRREEKNDSSSASEATST